MMSFKQHSMRSILTSKSGFVRLCSRFHEDFHVRVKTTHVAQLCIKQVMTKTKKGMDSVPFSIFQTGSGHETDIRYVARPMPVSA